MMVNKTMNFPSKIRIVVEIIWVSKADLRGRGEPFGRSLFVILAYIAKAVSV
jgi:hypothetical protein